MLEKKLIVLGHSKAGVPLLMDLANEIYGYTKFDILKNLDLPDVPYPSELYEAAHIFEQDYDFEAAEQWKVHFGVQHCSIKYILYQLFKEKYNIDKDRYIIIIHSTSYLAPSAHCADGVMIEPHCVVSSMAEIGFGVSVKRSASVGHHAKLGDFVNINPGAILSGFVEVGFGTEIGSGAVISNNIKIGEKTLIGAGSVVTKDIPDGVIAYGNPCKPVRENDRWNIVNTA